MTKLHRKKKEKKGYGPMQVIQRNVTTKVQAEDLRSEIFLALLQGKEEKLNDGC